MTGKRVRIGKIGAAHGMRGEVRLFVDADDPLAVRELGPFEDESGARQFEIAALRTVKDRLIARFEGVDDRSAAGRLTHVELFVPRDRLPEHDEPGRFYQADLIGLRAEDPDGSALGTVCAVANYGAGDLLEIAPAAGGATFLVPFVDRFVPEVDIAGGRVVIDAPDSLFEDR